VERDEDGLLCFGAEEMPTDRVEARWIGKHGGEGSAVESAVAKATRRSAIVESCRGSAVR
jgi:hypothetical protein